MVFMCKYSVKKNIGRKLKMVTTSARFNLIKPDLLKIVKGAGVAAAGAVATVLLQMIPGIDFGPYTVVVVALNSIICNAVLKFVSVNKY